VKIPSEKYLIAILIIVCLAALAWWLGYDPSSSLKQSIPGEDNRKSDIEASALIEIGKHFNFFADVKSDLQETWPRFRGESFDNICKSPVKLTDNPEDKDNRIKWSVKMGEGHAGPAVYKGLVYVLDYDEEKKADMLRCFSLTDGKELWQRWYNVNLKRNHGMSRTVPAVTEDFILTIGPQCHVMCLNRENGDFKWGIDIEKEFSSEVPFWYTGQCPLIDNGKAIIATGGKAIMIAVDCQTGERIWETPNPKGWKMSHSSVMPYVFNGRKMYVYSAVGGICGIAADGPDEGKILWKSSEWNHKVVAPSPVCMPDGKIFITAGYGAGSMVLQLSEDTNGYEVNTLQKYSPREGLACEQQTVIYYKGHLLGILPKDAAALRNQMVCVNPSDCKKILWSSGKTVRFGLGPYIIADGKIFILSDDGTLTIAKADVKRFNLLSQVKLFDGHDAWGPMAVADGYLLLRDSKEMYCLDMSEGMTN
jgi:outer membrane protein assembly factor BamB